MISFIPTNQTLTTGKTDYVTKPLSEILFLQVMDGFLEDYNVSSKAPMDLVMFRFAIEHVSRICRVLRQPNGHALLVGKNRMLKLQLSNVSSGE